MLTLTPRLLVLRDGVITVKVAARSPQASCTQRCMRARPLVRRSFVEVAKRLSNELSSLAKQRSSDQVRRLSLSRLPFPPCIGTASVTTARSSSLPPRWTFATAATTGIGWSSPSSDSCRCLGRTCSRRPVQDSPVQAFITSYHSPDKGKISEVTPSPVSRIPEPGSGRWSAGGRPVVGRWSAGPELGPGLSGGFSSYSAWYGF